MRCTPSSGNHGNGAYAPIPPVLGPSSLLKARLKSCAGKRGTTVSPSTRQNSDTSGPSRKDSRRTGFPPSSTASTCARAAARSGVTTTPLPAAKPSSLTTQVGPKLSSAASISSALAPGAMASACAVSTPCAAITSLAKALEPSIRAASLFGPNTAMPSSRRASATPATKGISGPMTTRSEFNSLASAVTASGSSALISG